MTDTSSTSTRLVLSEAKTCLTRHREHCDQCFILMEGLLARERRFDDGQRQIVGLNVPGDVCGLTALPDGATDYDMVALSPVSCLPVPRHVLMSSVRESGEMLQALWQEMARDTAISANWIVNMGHRSAYQRLAHFMCELEARLRGAGPDATSRLEWPGTQTDLSAATGLSLVHVNRTLRRLESDELLTCGRRIKVRDVERLRAIAEFDPAYLSLERDRLGDLLLSRLDEKASMESHFELPGEPSADVATA